MPFRVPFLSNLLRGDGLAQERPLRRRRAALRWFSAAGATAAACALLAAPSAAFPPFAEEWFVPGHPIEVEVDPTGRVWVACNDDSIRVYAATGGELLFAFGGSGTGDGQFQTPYGMAFDAAGDVYVCDYVGVRIEKFDASGNFLFSWPTPGQRTDHVALDAAGDVYVSGFSDQSVHKYTAAGVPILNWTSQGPTYPSGVVEWGGVIHVVQWLAPIVEQYQADGTYLGSFETGAQNATDIEVNGSGQLFLADYENGLIRVFAPDGTPLDSTGAVGTGSGEFQGLSGLAIGLDGSIYATDEQNSRLQRFHDSPAAVSPAIPLESALRSIAPNPCRSAITLSFRLPVEEHIRLDVFDIGGRRVGTLSEGPMPAGLHHVAWNAREAGGSKLPAGVYLVRLEHGERVDFGRFVVVR
ncbi:MAG: hypothetical protein IT347_07510 [Candidatus Eisenbacteria bacterium]|nr:hypothetical protein [Candidatus Eisenbacteria bacterium]